MTGTDETQGRQQDSPVTDRNTSPDRKAGPHRGGENQGVQPACLRPEGALGRATSFSIRSVPASQVPT